MISIDIRPYTPDDTAGITELFHRSVRQVARRDYSEAQVRAWAPDQTNLDHWRTRLAAAETWTAWIDNRLAGFTDLEADGHLDHLFVDPDFQRMGVATALVAQVERAARRHGLTRLHTEASLTARPAFERFRFELIAAQTVHRRGQDLRNFRMAKRLDAPAAALDAGPERS
ncbi:GNAT family N-acetyltransferase [Caulobacter sp. S45]|uniref:GNAT family N-acetyltransferase n=1 Tax=Caulobacter sp. S45 TaxID=1641861 RepID=UPI00131C5C92|nr:GNAT family N-acetyltransferase [Caulobacter sp. S45]